MERILSTKILKYIDDINVPDKWDLTPLHYLALFNDDMPETAMLLCRRGADLLRQSSRIGATPFQILTGRDRVAGIGFLVSAMSSSTISPAFVRRALEEGRPDFDKINRVLEERLQILKQQEAKMSEQLRAEFNARHSKPRATDIIEPTE
jgi:ankyrin repeat protein